MKTIHKSYKFRLYPNKAQKVLLAKHFGCVLFVYNHFLAQKKEQYETRGKSDNYVKQAASLVALKKEKEWLKEVNSQSLQQSLKHLDTAYKNFFKGQAKYPNFKSKLKKSSFKVPQSVKIENSKLIIPKFKEGLQLIVHRQLKGRILFATVSVTPTGKYFVSVTCEQSYKLLPKTDSRIGIDTGITHLAILSNSKKYDNAKSLKSSLKKLKYEQRQLSKKKKGSNSRAKQRKIVAAIHEKIVNIRKDSLHKITADIVKNHDTICIEDLAVKNMVKNHRLAQSLSDAALGTFYTMLHYKADWNDRIVVKIPRFQASSKPCSNCDWVYQQLKLHQRMWICPNCGTKHDRDINAAKNILKIGLKILSGCGT